MIEINGKNVADIVIDNKEVLRVQDATNLKVLWEKGSEEDEYFYIRNAYTGSNTITLITISNNPSGGHATQLEYSKDKENWTTVTLSGTKTIQMNSGEKVYFRNSNGYFNWHYYNGDNFDTNFGCQYDFIVGGNINTLIDYTNTNVSLDYGSFYGLFKTTNTSRLIGASRLVLPATTLTNSCYRSMFSGCSSLVTAPKLPATTLADSCYLSMFYGCSSLTTAPKLPATTMKDFCYDSMFGGCSSLVTAPALPATTLANYCYRSMFQSCNNLTTAPLTLPATTMKDSCYDSMFQLCTRLTTIPTILPATTLAEHCYSNMFNNCWAITTSPTLPATTLKKYCYQNMFSSCSSLNSVTTYANSISATDCIKNWLSAVAQTGTFHNLGSATYPSGASGIPTGWTEVNS